MEPEERKRYSRQIILPELGLSGQEKLKAAKVLVIGAGGLGCPVLQYLTAGGVGTIGIVDDDIVTISNLHRQILYSAEDIGKGKAQTAREKLSLSNPFINFNIFPLRLDSENASAIIANYDLVIDGSDNFPTRYLANDTCVELDKSLVFGSILRFEGQLSVFNYKGGPTYRCLFPEAEEGDNCAEAGVIGILPGIIGTYMANEAIKIICGIGEPLSGKLMVINSLTNETNIFLFERSVNLNTPKIIHNPVVTQSKSSEEISFDDFEHLQQSDPDSLMLIDVREEYEYEEDFVGGINIPLPELAENITKMPADKTVIFYCRSGARSLMAVNLLKKTILKEKAIG
ncbi:HesA/MoeB/ThiF family protein [Dyadobacter sp. NIV53]|uniref:HesA/MoeB/ThiF family protein n=1 Tax=Dyadobacter sp. NIV53 TaxID=2861765 RepID=UPI001C875D14|nr:HesA/MoeB/ThiF family protein [Dyadobacter sp. NIV53]